MKTGKLLDEHPNGLCYEPGFRSGAMELFEPTDEDSYKYGTNAYWASGYDYIEWDDPELRKDAIGGFTPLRQTIVLFLAAMNGEL